MQLVLFVGVEVSKRRRPSRSAAAERQRRSEKEFNLALLRVVDGKGSVVKALATLTGLSEDGVKSRVKRARWDYQDDEGPGELDAADQRYLARLYAKSGSPEVRQFMASVTGTPRRRPDWRSSKDPTPQGGKNRG